MAFLEMGTGQQPSQQSPIGETSPHKNRSQQESFGNPEHEVQNGIKMPKTHLEERLLSHAGRQPPCGTRPAQGLGTSCLSSEPTGTQTGDKKFC